MSKLSRLFRLLVEGLHQSAEQEEPHMQHHGQVITDRLDLAEWPVTDARIPGATKVDLDQHVDDHDRLENMYWEGFPPAPTPAREVA